MNPAQRIIEKFGGVKRLADEIGMQVPGVYKWTYGKDKGGTGGHIPKDKEIEIAAAAKRLNIDLRAEDFFPEGTFEAAGDGL